MINNKLSAYLENSELRKKVRVRLGALAFAVIVGCAVGLFSDGEPKYQSTSDTALALAQGALWRDLIVMFDVFQTIAMQWLRTALALAVIFGGLILWEGKK